MPSVTDLSLLSPREWQDMLQLGQTRLFSPGERVFAEGAPGLHVYIVREGLVELLKASVAGGCMRVAILDEGTIFGEGALFDASTRSTTARAFRDAVVQEVPKESLLAFLETRPSFSMLFYRAISERLHQAVVDLDADLKALHHQLRRDASSARA